MQFHWECSVHKGIAHVERDAAGERKEETVSGEAGSHLPRGSWRRQKNREICSMFRMFFSKCWCHPTQMEQNTGKKPEALGGRVYEEFPTLLSSIQVFRQKSEIIHLFNISWKVTGDEYMKFPPK